MIDGRQIERERDYTYNYIGTKRNKWAIDRYKDRQIGRETESYIDK